MILHKNRHIRHVGNMLLANLSLAYVQLQPCDDETAGIRMQERLPRGRPLDADASTSENAKNVEYIS